MKSSEQKEKRSKREILIDVLKYQTGLTAEEITDALLEICNPSEAHLPIECREHRCSYFGHYELYYDPSKNGKKLSHEGYHVAEKKCEERLRAGT